MTCRNAQKEIILLFYDELEEIEKQGLMHHIESCRNCREQFHEMSRFVKGLGRRNKTELTGRWDDYWSHIVEKVRNGDSKKRFALPVFKWGFTLAGFALFLILGIFIGRFFFFDSGNRFERVAANREIGSQAVLYQYLEDMKPLMLDLSNSPVSMEKTDRGSVERVMIRSMLTQTRLLRSRLSFGNDPYLNSLLVDIELILMEVDNTVPGDRVMIKSVQDMIHQKDIPIKIDFFQQKARQTRKI